MDDWTPGPIAAPILDAIIRQSMVKPRSTSPIIKDVNVRAKDRRQQQRENAPDMGDMKKEEQHEREERERERDLQRRRQRKAKEFFETSESLP